jgi:DNA-binding transcriptional LysR family regulator
VVRFGVPENFMGDRLVPLLGQFTRAFPTVRLEVYVDVCLDLRGKIAEGELDLAVVTTLAAPPEETVLRPAQFVWVAAETFDPPRGAPLPLAFSPAPCAMRDLAITALSGTAVDWHVMFTSPSLRGLCAAVQAGLAISVMTRDEVEPGMRVVDGQYGLPALPKGDFSLVWSPGGKTAAAREFGRMILAMPEPLAAPTPRLVANA